MPFPRSQTVNKHVIKLPIMLEIKISCSQTKDAANATGIYLHAVITAWMDFFFRFNHSRDLSND